MSWCERLKSHLLSSSITVTPAYTLKADGMSILYFPNMSIIIFVWKAKKHH